MPILSIFNQQDASSTFNHYLKDMEDEIMGKPNDYILNVNVDEWLGYFVNKYDFIPITIYVDKAEVKFQRKGKARRGDRGHYYDIETYVFDLIVPYTGDSSLFALRPGNCRLDHPTVTIFGRDNGTIHAEITLDTQDEKQFISAKDRLMTGITINVPNINRELEKFKKDVPMHFDFIYKRKKSKVIQENEFFEKINIQVNQPINKTFTVPTIEKRKVPEPKIDKKEQKFVENVVLPDAFYDDVLKRINTFYKAVEKKPRIYSEMDEEGLRDYILPTLETGYVDNSTVTGETFNKSGKTDILVRYKDGTNLFVAECKFWKGEVALLNTIEQLFKYLTWRDSKSAIIFFVTNKDMSRVLTSIKETVRKHPSLFKENGSRGESSFSYIFHFPGDKGKYIYTEIMAFHFPASE